MTLVTATPASHTREDDFVLTLRHMAANWTSVLSPRLGLVALIQSRLFSALEASRYNVMIPMPSYSRDFIIPVSSIAITT